ncbi:MAG: SGNH/GDSL hydrolase family protein [Planctomycetes bacterium]|nr:SGNH/GDSL hydrolase family protein [Planctomycetota bacterium]
MALTSALLVSTIVAQAADPPTDGDPRWDSFYLRDGETVVFLGDSITHAGGYIEYIDACLATRFPKARLRLINRGMPSETVAGTSESVHNPPRPDLATRFERTIAPLDPDVIVACYGMNDGIYQSPSDEILKKYQAGVERLIDRVRKGTRARLVLLSPPPFDITPRKGKLKSGGTASYLNPAEDYDQALAKFSAWLLTTPRPAPQPDDDDRRWRASSPLVVDLHTPINKHMAERRKQDPGFGLARDGIHPNATGHWLIARQVLLAFGTPGTVAVAEIAADSKQVLSGEVQELRSVSGGLEFVWTTPLPMPADPNWDAKSIGLSLEGAQLNRYTLRVTELPAGRYDLSADGRKFASASDIELATGLDMTRYADFPTVKESGEVLKLIRKRQSLQSQLWLKEETHPRLAAEHAKLANVMLKPDEIEKLGDEIRRRCLARPVKIQIAIAAKEPVAARGTAKEKEITIRDPDWKRDASPEMGLQGHRANQTSRRNAGSAAMLDGPTLVYQVFVSDKKSSWNDKRKEEIRDRVNEALGFLCAQGLKYQQRVEIAQQFGEPVTLDEVIPSDSQADSAWTDRAIKQASGLDCSALIEKLRTEQKMKSVLLMLHINKPGRSYNISYYRGVPKDLMSERLICFTHFNHRDQTPAATYAHEMLHGFGAGDLYFPFDQDDDRYLRAKRIFPNDVMLRIDERISRLSVDEWTAYRVGWLKTLRPELRFLEDPR